MKEPTNDQDQEAPLSAPLPTRPDRPRAPAPMVTLDQAWDAIVAAIVAQLAELKAQTRRDAQAEEKPAG